MGQLDWRTIKDYVDSHGGNWHSVYAEQETGFGPARSAGPQPIDFGDRIPATYPELGVFELPQGYVLSPHGWVLGHQGSLLPEFSWYGENISEMVFPASSPGGIRLEGAVLSLLSDWADENYGHLLLDSMSRYHLFQKAGFGIEDIAGVLCPGASNARLCGFLDRLGIPANKRIWSDTGPCFSAQTVIVTSFPGIRRVYPKWVAAFLRETFSAPAKRKDRRLYISRGTGTRKVTNDAALLPILDKFGFERYNPAENAYPPADFGEAEIVVGAHGAGLTDIVFCPPGGKLLELMPSDHVFPHYYTLAISASLEYMGLAGQSDEERDRNNLGPSPHDFTVDVEVFEQALSELLMD